MIDVKRARKVCEAQAIDSPWIVQAQGRKLFAEALDEIDVLRERVKGLERENEQIVAQWRKALEYRADLHAADVIERVDGRAIVRFEIGWIATLAHNLAIAAGLCRAFDDGWLQATDLANFRIWPREAWIPGCGRGAP